MFSRDNPPMIDLEIILPATGEVVSVRINAYHFAFVAPENQQEWLLERYFEKQREESSVNNLN